MAAISNNNFPSVIPEDYSKVLGGAQNMLTIAEHIRDYIKGNVDVGTNAGLCDATSTDTPAAPITSPKNGQYFLQFDIQNQQLINGSKKHGSLIDHFLERLEDIPSYEEWLLIKDQQGPNIFTKLLFPLDSLLHLAISPFSCPTHDGDPISVTEQTSNWLPENCREILIRDGSLKV